MVFIAIAIVAVTEFLKRLQASDWYGAVVIVVAAVIGAIAGAFHVEGLTVFNGVVAGLGAVGIHQVARQIG